MKAEAACIRTFFVSKSFRHGLDPHFLLFSRNLWHLPRRIGVQSVKITTDVHIILRIRN